MATNYLDFQTETTQQAITEWFQWLQDAARDRAQLRRCTSPLDVLFQPAYYRLHRKLRPLGSFQEERLACVIGLLAHIDQALSQNNSLAQQMGQSNDNNETPKVSGLRFRRLLEIKSHEELYLPMIRVLRHLNRQANLMNFICSIYYWNSQTKQRWAIDYYQAAPQSV